MKEIYEEIITISSHARQGIIKMNKKIEAIRNKEQNIITVKELEARILELDNRKQEYIEKFKMYERSVRAIEVEQLKIFDCLEGNGFYYDEVADKYYELKPELPELEEGQTLKED